MVNEYFGLVGSRSAPKPILEIFIRLGRTLVDKGIGISSGDAYGIDRAAYYGAKQSKRFSEVSNRIFIVSEGFRGRATDDKVFFDMTKYTEGEERRLELVKEVRGNTRRLNETDLALHCRIVPQVLGLNFEEKISGMFLYTSTKVKSSKGKGGTSTAYGLARKFNVELIKNLYDKEDLEWVLEWLQENELDYPYASIDWKEIIDPGSLYGPSTDGIDHININSKSRCELGLMLSNFTNTSFTHPEYGNFKSMENFYAWIVTEEEDKDHLRDCSPYEAREVIKNTKRDMEALSNILKEALVYKFKHNKRIAELFLENRELPFKHYYWYGNDLENVKIITQGNSWLVEGWTTIRERFLNWYDNKQRGKK